MSKMLWGATKSRIQRLYSIDGFSKDELLVMYRDYHYKDVLVALRGVQKAERI